MIAGYQTLKNHAGDQDLTKFIDELIQNGLQEIKQLEGLLKENGVGLPPTPPKRPNVCVEDIPVGARLQTLYFSFDFKRYCRRIGCLQPGYRPVHQRGYRDDIWTISYAEGSTWG